ncbi:hypothetical protein [Emcibacter nanhaiensis]|uniref:Uncharacterized protein n=1 Tax=Emcibacter nanhaiensis TaxID=1505037 RepID=A0A501PHI5_9PROT|nr:hypothetical protein [Emcibacter nanhaiensis]TPD59404.1 hypothetical protein FIV46_11460 [Emcibacter nanhaiensis]
MGVSKFSPAVQARLARANAMIAEEADTYAHMMQAELVELAMAMSERDYTRMHDIAYDIESRAGTFDWPLVTQAAGMMRELINEGHGLCPAMEAIRDSIALMMRNDLKGMTAEGRVLLETLRAAVKRELGT